MRTHIRVLVPCRRKRLPAIGTFYCIDSDNDYPRALTNAVLPKIRNAEAIFQSVMK